MRSGCLINDGQAGASCHICAQGVREFGEESEWLLRYHDVGINHEALIFDVLCVWDEISVKLMPETGVYIFADDFSGKV